MTVVHLKHVETQKNNGFRVRIRPNIEGLKYANTVELFALVLFKDGKNLCMHSLTSKYHHQIAFSESEASDVDFIRTYWPNLSLHCSERIVNSLRNGKIVTYDEDGYKKDVVTFVDGVLHGDYIKFHKNGEPRVTG